MHYKIQQILDEYEIVLQELRKKLGTSIVDRERDVIRNDDDLNKFADWVEAYNIHPQSFDSIHDIIFELSYQHQKYKEVQEKLQRSKQYYKEYENGTA